MDLKPHRTNRSVRLVCAAVTVAALFFAARKIDFQLLVQTLRHTRPEWFLISVTLFGVACLLAGWRWHLVLRLMNISSHFGATARLTLIGHFFYTILFGAAGADTARSALYVRWYRFPLPEVLVSISLDRLLALAGLVLFAVAGFTLGAANGAFHRFSEFQLAIPRGKMITAAAFLVLCAAMVWRWRPKKDSFPARVFQSFLEHGRLLTTSRKFGPRALLAGFLVQAILSCLLAFNLQAVAAHPVPWTKLFWIFPMVFLLSSLPISVGGLGIRETAAIAFLGFYGIPANEAVAASLLTFAATMLWMAIGGVVFLREETLFARFSPLHRPPQNLSVIIPTLNEASALPELVAGLKKIPEILEIIVADGGSSDATRDIALGLGCRVVSGPRGRGRQMRQGAETAQGDVIWLLHADTWMPPDAGSAILNCLRDPTVVAGGCWKIFYPSHFLMRGSRWRCATRLYLFRRIAGDQAIFVRREILEKIGGVPEMPLMEEFELCRRLRRQGRLALADAVVVTSARRFLERGILRTYARMGRVTIQYFLGATPEALARLYEK